MKRATPQSSPSSTSSYFGFVSPVVFSGVEGAAGLLLAFLRCAFFVLLVCFFCTSPAFSLLGVGVVEVEASDWVADPLLVDPVPLGFCATATVVASANAHSKTRNLFIDESPVDPTSQGKFVSNAREYIPAQC